MKLVGRKKLIVFKSPPPRAAFLFIFSPFPYLADFSLASNSIFLRVDLAVCC